MKKREFISVGIMVGLLAIFFVGCSSDDDPVTPPPPTSGVNETIGATGGNIEISGQASLTIPANALDGNVNFTMADAGSNHEDMVSVRALGSAVYSIGPAGTTFNDPVQLVLHYDEADLNGVAESSILIYTENGSGWTALPTTVDEVANTATAEITHLSDFAVTTPVGAAAEGVYGIFEVTRLVNYLGEGVDNQHVDIILARFDGIVNMCSPVEPMYPDSVYCNTYGMSYDDMVLAYVDENESGDFLNLGETYTFHVLASDDVPALEPAIAMVDHEPAITNIDHMDAVSNQGFTVQWNDTSAGNVTLFLALSSVEVVVKEVPNNGSYTFTADDLASLNPGTYVLGLVNHQKIMLDNAPGYDPNSYIVAYTQDLKMVHLSFQSGLIGSAGGTLMLGDDGHLLIPAGALDENILFTAEIAAGQAVGPENYTLLTPVYSVEPDGTDFALPATVHFNYLEATVGDAVEEDIVIFADSGSGWVELNSHVFEYMDYVEAPVSSLSAFVAAVPTPIVTEGIYAVLDVNMTYTNQGGRTIAGTDILFARFDAEVGEDPVSPLQAGTVTLGEWELVWDEEDSYSYVDYLNPAFLSLGHTYDFEVVAGTSVPALDIPIEILSDEVYVSNLEVMQEIPLSGFTLEWNGSSLGSTVNIIVMDYGGHGLNIDVPNTGTYTFTEAELSEMEALSGLISLFWEDQVPIVATGYDSHSHVLFTTSNVNHVVFTDEVVTQQVTYTETPSLVITDRINGQPVTPVTDTINVTATGVVDSIRVYLDITHGYSSDLTFKLTSPDGTELRVFWIGEGGEPAINPVGWYPDNFTPKDDLNGFDGGNINGQWTLTAADNSYGEGGTLNEWRIHLFYVE